MNWFIYISDFSLLMPFAYASWLEFSGSRLARELCHLTWYISFALAAQIVMVVFAEMNYSNTWITHIYFPMEVLLIGLYAGRLERRYSILIYIVVIIAFLCSIIDNFLIVPYNRIAVESAALTNLLLFLLSARMLYVAGRYSIKLKYDFWIALAFCFYFAFSSFFFLSFNTLFLPPFYAHAGANIFKNLLLTKGLVCYRRRQLVIPSLSHL